MKFVVFLFGLRKENKTSSSKECNAASCVNHSEQASSSSSESLLVCSIGLSSVDIHPNNITDRSKVVSVCPVVKHAAVNTENIICKHVSIEIVNIKINHGFLWQQLMQHGLLLAACDRKICSTVAIMTEPNYFIPLRKGKSRMMMTQFDSTQDFQPLKF